MKIRLFFKGQKIPPMIERVEPAGLQCELVFNFFINLAVFHKNRWYIWVPIRDEKEGVMRLNKTFNCRITLFGASVMWCGTLRSFIGALREAGPFNDVQIKSDCLHYNERTKVPKEWLP